MFRTSKQLKNQTGFTLIEVLVSTSIFIIVVSAMLGLFDYTLKINRRVQALREVVQGTRTFTETLTREIRNGRIDYSSWTPECAASNYLVTSNQSLSLIDKSGDKLCFYFDSTTGKFSLKRQSPSGVDTAQVFDSPNFTVLKSSFSFGILPETDPNVDRNPDPLITDYPRIQPLVIIAAQFIVTSNVLNSATINYETTISTDVYDILK